MRESAKQGFWNGATPSLGYKIVEAERRGQKIKKKLDIDLVEAETVRLIFRLYLEGDETTGPWGERNDLLAEPPRLPDAARIDLRRRSCAQDPDQHVLFDGEVALRQTGFPQRRSA